MVPLIITLLQWEFVVTTMVIFFSVMYFYVDISKNVEFFISYVCGVFYNVCIFFGNLIMKF